MSSPRARDIPVRRMHFKLPEALDPVIVPRCPEESFVYMGLSLLLPHLEPYLIRTMRAALRQVDDPELAAQVKQFCAQEGQHYRQHEALNRAAGLLDVPALVAINEEIAADYRRFSEERSLQFNLAYAEGFEAATAALGLAALRSGLFDRLDPVSAELWRWHTIEELEHRCVAFDAYERLFGDYRYRLRVGLFAHRHLAGISLRVARAMLAAHPERKVGAQPGRLWRFAYLLGRHFVPRLLASYLPSYNPAAIVLPEDFSSTARRYTERATRVS